MKKRVMPNTPEPLYPAHQHGRFRLLPRNMSWLECSMEQIQVMQGVALSIFTDASNNGFALREALAAVYLSGLQHGVEAPKDVKH
jgi:hypothetical protein